MNADATTTKLLSIIYTAQSRHTVTKAVEQLRYHIVQQLDKLLTLQHHQFSQSRERIIGQLEANYDDLLSIDIPIAGKEFCISIRRLSGNNYIIEEYLTRKKKNGIIIWVLSRTISEQTFQHQEMMESYANNISKTLGIPFIPNVQHGTPVSETEVGQ